MVRYTETHEGSDALSFDGSLNRLPESFREILLSMYRGQPQRGLGAELHSLDAKTKIDPHQGMWLYDWCRREVPKATLEIGLAYGYSALYFLAAIRENGIGHHTAIDPFQSYWKGVGAGQAARVGMSEEFSLVEERSFPALVHLADRGLKFDVIFIDGNHRYDDVLVDFILSVSVCSIGGLILLDDMWMPSITRAAAFIRTNRKDFEEIKTPVVSIAAFRRVRDDSRNWDYDIPFSSSGDKYSRLVSLAKIHSPIYLHKAFKALTRSTTP